MSGPTPPPAGPRPVTPGGHDPQVWADVVAAAPRTTPAALVADLLGRPGPAAPDPWPTLVVAAAHPDDETLGLGRLAHAWSRHAGVVGVLASAGEACLDHVGPRPAGLVERRDAEWRAATARLGFSALHTLGLPDGGLAGHEDDLAERLATLLDPTGERGPVVLAAPWRLDPHPDHQAVGRAAARVAAELRTPLLEYPVWATFWADPGRLAGSGQRLLVVEHDADDDAAHAAAVALFTSQTEPLDDTLGPVLPPAMLDHHGRQLVLRGAPAAGGPR